VSLERSYTLLAPFYDLVAGPAFGRARQASLTALHEARGRDVFLDGVGTGLDLAYLPPTHRYTTLDLTGAMLRRALPRARGLDIAWTRGNSEALPFRDEAFDYVVLHLIIAVVPHPDRAFVEAARVVKAGGTVLLFDKFLAPDERAPLRRMLNPFASRIATRMDVVFETLLERTPRLRIVSDEPQLARGWFRRIRLEKR
jgi:phosphatidylethanolamine/phosphatidyl-N-methylethanolamine N-methyltransferase